MHTNIVWTGGDASRRRPTHQPQKETIMKRLIVAARSDLPISRAAKAARYVLKLPRTKAARYVPHVPPIRT